ncbi:hypothetical protein GCK72_025521 [Caenorhabditis remanei]|uniref:Uncharacterized protein n=1 Tax=Caenorhabditis remanei TaxID=31234 RepID=A0A6A5G339_CAERE|nr:hypothetical protein GCK72_025521 [Caenorhabditis remanei]KAF1749054.1 hypothetical protein GCK72_025521 [Caenorhabditis remanei]
MRTDTLVLSGDTIRFVFNLFPYLIEVDKSVTLLMEELRVLITVLNELKNQWTTSDDTGSTWKKVSGKCLFSGALFRNFRLFFLMTHFPTKFSNTDDFPADCPPTTAICGNSKLTEVPSCENASCTRLITGISACIPWLAHAMAVSGG